MSASVDRSSSLFYSRRHLLGIEGLTAQEIDGLIDFDGSHSSVAEAIQDVINGANRGSLPEPTRTLAQRWAGESRNEALRVQDWEVTALVGTAR